MKTWLRISFVLNLCLASALTFVLWTGQARVETNASQDAVETPSPAGEATAAATPASSPAAAMPFRWSQLDSGDYHGYVRNLRAIGCPERTLRAVVAADVYAAHQVRINAIKKEIADLTGSSWTNQLAAVGRDAVLKAELQQIPDDEADEINDFLGAKPGRTQAAAPVFWSHRQPVSLPLAWQAVDLTALNLNAVQKQALAGVRQSFVAQIGDPGQNLNDPAYLERWQQAQPAADDLLRAMLGTTFYQNYQLLAAEDGLDSAVAKP